MGYETEFQGSIEIEPPLQGHHRAYLEKFFETRRMKRNSAMTAKRPDPLREAVGLPVGSEGCFFVNEDGPFGQGTTLFGEIPDVVDHNRPADCQPGLWCLYRLNDQGQLEACDGKNYRYIAWLDYLIETFFKPWGYKLNGAIRWRGEAFEDFGILEVKNNGVSTRELNL